LDLRACIKILAASCCRGREVGEEVGEGEVGQGEEGESEESEDRKDVHGFDFEEQGGNLLAKTLDGDVDGE
jgi:hypothetical protein